MRLMIQLMIGLLSLMAGELQAQRLAGPAFPSIEAPAPRGVRTGDLPRVSVPALTAGGVLGGALGLFGGAYMGASFTEDSCEDCSIVGAIYGGVAGGSTLLPLGVHLANGRRGDYGKSLLMSLAIGAVGFGISDATDEWGLMFAVPVAQLISSITIERRTSRFRVVHTATVD